MGSEIKAQPIVKLGTSIRSALAVINEGGYSMAVISDAQDIILGVVTDGDIRRFLLDGGTLDNCVDAAMHTNPVLVDEDGGDIAAQVAMDENGIFAIPTINRDGHFVRVRHVSEFSHLESPVFSGAVIMAGGEGQRLRPMTEKIPKPMIEVAGKPLIERIVDRLADSGVENVHVAVNYLGDQIRNHLGDGSGHGTTISYLEETKKLGTAGALALLDIPKSGSILAMNGDILSEFNIKEFSQFHKSQNCGLTVGVVNYSMEIPYGVVRTRDGRITELQEKPTHRVHINAGIYAIEPRLLSLIPKDTFYNMTDLIADAISAGEVVAPFLIHEHWIDIGSPKDLEAANAMATEMTRKSPLETQ